MDWIFPYWAEQQYNPQSKSFIPRSHLGLSMNITHRNWTAVGNPDCEIEPIVDPRGLVMPFKNSWSIDVWLMVDDEIFFPSRSEKCGQNLIADVPAVETCFKFKDIRFTLTTYTYKNKLFHKASLINNSGKSISLKIIFSIRPFNPEGIALLNSIEFDEKDNRFIIEQSQYVYFDFKPELIYCSNFKDGDAESILTSKNNGKQRLSSCCSAGLVSAVAVYQINLTPGVLETLEAFVPLKENEKHHPVEISKVKNYWDNISNSGITIKTPDAKLNSLLKSSITSLLMLTDGDTITPGPFTYHQFWFRDAAYMLWALDNFGFHSFTKKIINSYSAYQTSKGYFRSQKGEWDSNGQAIWTVFQHYKLTRDESILSSNFDSFFLAVKWIKNKRLTEKIFLGLLPAGMSAEHLGLADHYFWDNFWSLSGIKSFIEICKILGREEELKFSEELYIHYNLCLNKAIEEVQKKYCLNSIPASPSRSIDCGMIGNVCAVYPLQLFEADDPMILSTLEVLRNKYFVNSLFFQHFIHSGMNPYLTLQIAHSYLYAGKREIFWKILNDVISFSSPTKNFPEAIHPFTKGGAMGDGHHGWVSAEMALAFHDIFIFEKNSLKEQELILLQGIPREWFFSSQNFSIEKAPVSDGVININIFPGEDKLTIDINFIEKISAKRNWKLNLPFEFLSVEDGENFILDISKQKDNTSINLIPGSMVLKFKILKQKQLALS